MPRCFSSSIQSEVAARRPARALTAPASAASAPPYSRNFSVSVVLPASGWLMMANVRRRAASSAGERTTGPGYRRGCGGYGASGDGVVAGVDEVVAAEIAGQAEVH